MFSSFTSFALVALLSLSSLTDVSAKVSNVSRQAQAVFAFKENVAPKLSKDGKSIIVDLTTQIQNTNLRFRVSAPAEQYNQNPAGQKNLGLNVLLHGDGGQSFGDFPNQNVQDGLMGVVVLAPNQQRLWGGGGGLNRPDGPKHSALVNSLIRDALPQFLTFNQNNVQFTGVSGGSLLLSGFFVPTFGATFGANARVLLNCGGMAPQVNVKGDISKLKIHFQSTGNELGLLKRSIPQSIAAYTKVLQQAGLTGKALDAVLTGDAKLSNGGHCAFDGRGFVGGIQLMADNYSNVMQNRKGTVGGRQVLKSVEKNPNIFQ